VHIEIIEPVAQPNLSRGIGILGEEARGAGIMGVEIFDDSGMMRSFALSRSTGNLPIGQILSSAARSSGLLKSTICGVNGVSFSYSAISAFQQNEDSG
jgi:hypothetical protein